MVYANDDFLTIYKEDLDSSNLKDTIRFFLLLLSESNSCSFCLFFEDDYSIKITLGSYNKFKVSEENGDSLQKDIYENEEWEDLVTELVNVIQSNDFEFMSYNLSR